MNLFVSHLCTGIEYLYENHLLKTDEQDVAQFLYKGEGLNKTAIGKLNPSIQVENQFQLGFLYLCSFIRWLSGREEAIQWESAESFCRASRLHKSHPGASFKVNKPVSLSKQSVRSFFLPCHAFIEFKIELNFKLLWANAHVWQGTLPDNTLN